VIRLPGAWYCDSTPAGAYVALFPGSHLQTHRGRVELPHGQNLLYVRIAPDGLRFAGAGHSDDLVWEWDGTSWTSHGAAYGVSPVIYGLDGTLLKNDGSWGSQGARFVDDDIDVITGDDTYFSPDMELSEWSELSESQLIYVGQSHPDGTNDAAWIWDAGTHRLLEPGPCRFIRAQRDGDRVSIAIWKPDQGAVIYWLTLAEIHALPVVPNVGMPTPNPGTPPAPIPEPPMPLPDPHAVRAALQRERDKFSAPLTDNQCGAIINAAALKFPHVGMHRKTSGSFATLPNGERVNRNVMRYLPPGDSFGWWADVLGAAGVGIATPLAPDWQRSTDDGSSFVPPVGATSEPPTTPNPVPPTQPPATDIESRLRYVENRLAELIADLRSV
jgi:hypothetical protein